MIENLQINGVHADIDNDLHKYVVKKIGHLDKYMSKHARESAHAEVILKESRAKQRRQHTAEVILFLPHGQLTAKETTINIFAAVDIVEAKLRGQLQKYKAKQQPRLHRRIIRRLRRGGQR